MILGWRCPVCGTSGSVPCAPCHASMRPATAVPILPGVDWAGALLSYKGTARELVARIKFRNQRAAIRWLAEGMATLAGSLTPGSVCWAPANRDHVRQRGFDHGALLARDVARRLGAPVAPLLERGDDAPLTGRVAAARAVELSARRCEGDVLVVDDVITTGATSISAARALRAAGANRVFVLAAAYTPPPGTSL